MQLCLFLFLLFHVPGYSNCLFWFLEFQFVPCFPFHSLSLCLCVCILLSPCLSNFLSRPGSCVSVTVSILLIPVLFCQFLISCVFASCLINYFLFSCVPRVCPHPQMTSLWKWKSWRLAWLKTGRYGCDCVEHKGHGVHNRKQQKKPKKKPCVTDPEPSQRHLS